MELIIKLGQVWVDTGGYGDIIEIIEIHGDYDYLVCKVINCGKLWDNLHKLVRLNKDTILNSYKLSETTVVKDILSHYSGTIVEDD